MKKITALVLVFSLMLSMMPLMSFATDTVKVSNSNVLKVELGNTKANSTLDTAKQNAKKIIRYAGGKSPSAKVWGIIDRYCDTSELQTGIIDKQTSVLKVMKYTNKALLQISLQKKSDFVYAIKVKFEQASVLLKALLSGEFTL